MAVATWSRQELDRAFDHYLREVDVACETGDWTHFADLFAPDATYVEHLYGRFAGRQEILGWITPTMGTFPGSEMTSFPIAWHTVDEQRGWIICEIRNVMRDPGDGSTFEASNITILRYAGDGLWAEEEDVYNPADFLAMVQAYLRRCHRLGTLSQDGRRWAQAMHVDLGTG